MDLPLARPEVPYVEFGVPPSWSRLVIRMGGHFSKDSTVVFQGVSGSRIEYINMRRMDRRNLYSNAAAGNDDFSMVVVEQNVQAYDAIRVSSTRLAPSDAIVVEFCQQYGSDPSYVALLNGVRAMDELDRASQVPSYVIAEEPDSVVDLLCS